MRVISGTAKGHKLKSPAGRLVRPTTDRVKESLFNIIAPKISGSRILDLFSGTGSLGIEALSRGAEYAYFVDNNRLCVKFIYKNLEHTHLVGKAAVLCADACDSIRFLNKKAEKFDILFMDPPYLKNFVEITLENIAKHDIMLRNGVVAVERHKNEIIPENMGTLHLEREKEYGETVYSFYVAR